MSSVHWGNVAEWLAALFTGGAFFVTFQLLKTEIQARRSSEQDRSERDARRVAAWWHERRKTFEAEWKIVVFVRNAGETPIYDVVVSIGPAVSHGDEPPKEGLDLHLKMVPPGHTTERVVEARQLELDIATEVPDEDGFYFGPWIEVAFTDSDGRFWRRERNGRLRPRESRALTS